MDAQQITKQLHAQWLIAKEQLRLRCQAAGKTEVAQKIAACTLFKGTESVSELARLLSSPQGLEFTLATNFPNLATLRLFKPFHPERHGVYIDAGNIMLNNPGNVILVGRTVATINCDSPELHTVTAMHGAAATVLASGWAVVSCNAGSASNLTKRTSGNAIILS